MFTGTFKTSSLASKSVATFTAMLYDGTGIDDKTYNNQWIVSDNCGVFDFDADGKLESKGLVYERSTVSDSEDKEDTEDTEGTES